MLQELKEKLEWVGLIQFQHGLTFRWAGQPFWVFWSDLGLVFLINWIHIKTWLDIKIRKLFIQSVKL